MNSNQAKKIPLFDLLAHLGHHPKETRKAGNDVWYNSPFRNENEPSFKLKLDDNVWFDHGEGAGGNVIDFVIKYRNTDFRGALAFLEGTRLTRQESSISLRPPVPDLFHQKKEKDPEILEIKPVFSYALKNYLAERAISPDVAYRHLKEIRFKVEDKNFFALGFRNRAGGWELRSSIFKGAIGKKDVSLIQRGSNAVSCYEGFFDFLSAETMKQDRNVTADALILNSIALKKQALEVIKAGNYQQVHTYFDNDPAGEKALEFFRQELPGREIISHNSQYAGYNDLNDLLIDQNSRNQQIKQ